MTKREAKAVLVCQRRINAALDSCAKMLANGSAKDYFNVYWGANIRYLANGTGYGSAPIVQAEDVMSGKQA